MLRRLLRALTTGPRPAPTPFDVLDARAWDEPIDYWPVDALPTPVELPPHLLPTTCSEIAYDPTTGALVRVPAIATQAAPPTTVTAPAAGGATNTHTARPTGRTPR